MKKTIFCLAAGAMALTACTSTDVIEEGIQSNAIGFQNVVSKNTRAIDSKDDLTTFYVYGFYTKKDFETSPVVIFDGDKVTGSGNTWSYGDTYRYWVPDMTYKFYAYSCENNQSALGANGSASMSFDEYGEPTVGIDGYLCSNDHQHDLLFAKKDDGIVGKQNNNEKVSFNFNHILSKLKVKFVSGFPAGYDLKISAVQLSNVYTKGDYTVTPSTAEWTITEGTSADGTLSVAVPDDKNTASAKTDEANAVDVLTNEIYVIPHKYTTTNVGIRFRVDITNGDTPVMSRVFSGTWTPNWASGTAYTYTINISGENASLEKIEFGDMNVGTWSEVAGPTLTFGAPTNPAN